MSDLNYCIKCGEAMETISFVTKVGYSGLFLSAPGTNQPLAFCPNPKCPRHGLASIKRTTELPQRLRKTEAKKRSGKNAKGRQEEGK